MIDLGIHREQILAETAKAYKIELRSGVTSFSQARPVWIPKSQVTWKKSLSCYAETMHVPAWLARSINQYR